MTWREAFAEMQLEVEEKIGRVQRERVAQLNADLDAADAALKASAG